ncbi:trimeric intracellular cation channel family protein [Chrysiogenes arsenatis]|uniref:trimeric intracellular cation channel family protein n=1 Tax=Chrysiogenes arsenatis TaxID=309797 RepID=UPI000410EE8B|nr:trimeric intracellular cation channel family protein [Chrysiogenes arsenatis]
MNIFFIADVIGLSAFAVSGFLVGVRARLDLLGVIIAAFLTGVGGGIARDAIVNTTPFAFRENYPLIVIIVSLVLALLFRLHRRGDVDRHALLIVADSIGLIAFSITGALVAIEHQLNFFGIISLAFLTAVGGGIIRDVMINEVPFILKTDFYGSVALLIGIAFYWLDRTELLSDLAIFVVAAVGLSLRLFAYFTGWKLPTFDTSPTSPKDGGTHE